MWNSFTNIPQPFCENFPQKNFFKKGVDKLKIMWYNINRKTKGGNKVKILVLTILVILMIVTSNRILKLLKSIGKFKKFF